MKECINCNQDQLRQDPLEAILVIFGRRALIFLFESSWKNMKNDTTFVRMRSGDPLGDAKMSKKRHLAPSNLTFLLITRDRNGFSRMKDEGRIYKKVTQIFKFFAQGLSYDLSKFSDDFTPFFRLWKTITKSLAKD